MNITFENIHFICHSTVPVPFAPRTVQIRGPRVSAPNYFPTFSLSAARAIPRKIQANEPEKLDDRGSDTAIRRTSLLNPPCFASSRSYDRRRLSRGNSSNGFDELLQASGSADIAKTLRFKDAARRAATDYFVRGRSNAPNPILLGKRTRFRLPSLGTG